LCWIVVNVIAIGLLRLLQSRPIVHPLGSSGGGMGNAMVNIVIVRKRGSIWVSDICLLVESGGGIARSKSVVSKKLS
jgi:hypothetical protein